MWHEHSRRQMSKSQRFCFTRLISLPDLFPCSVFSSPVSPRCCLAHVLIAMKKSG
jgi:hypothetical protein